MLRKKMMKSALALSMIAGLAFTGCGKTDSAMEDKETASAQSAVVSEDTKELDYIKNLTYSDYNNFTKLEDAKLPCEFENTFDNEKYEEDYTITGSYDLDQDGKEDTITFLCNRDTMRMKLTINDASVDGEFPTPGNAYVVDVDKSDSIIDLVLYDGGMSDDPNYTFYRYDGKSIRDIGTVGTLSNGSIGFDGHNRAAKLDSFVNHLNPPMLLSYYEVKDNEWQMQEFDMTNAEQKEYTILDTDIDGFFAQTDAKIDEFERTWDKDEAITLHAGDAITINKIGEFESYEVKLADGRTGILYFWIGD